MKWDARRSDNSTNCFTVNIRDSKGPFRVGIGVPLVV